LFNASSQLISTSDTITKILPAVPVCVPVTITTQPSVVNGCAGGNAIFTVVAAGTTPVYQWQVNTGSGFVNLANGAPYSGVTTATLTITGVTGAMTGYLYRCVLSNTCTVAFNSGSAALNVGAVATITTQPSGSTVCTGVNTTFTVTATGATSYQWQVNTGLGFVDVTNTAPYSGATTATLTITGAAAGMTGYQYRCVLGSCGTPVNSAAATLTISIPVSITTQPANTSICEGSNTAFTVAITGSASGFQWQISTDGGTVYNNISGATTSTYNLAAIPVGMNAYRFRCVVTGACGPVTSNAAILTVNPLPVFSLGGVIPAVICVSDQPITLNTPAGGGGAWTGTGVQGNTFTPSAAGVGATTLTFTRTTSGCTTAHSIAIQVNECKDRHIPLDRYPALIVYPNPNDGPFSIRVNTDLYTRLGMKVFNNDGQLLKTQQFDGIFYGSVLSVDLSRMPAGAYHLYLFNDENGSFISKGVSIIITKK
jgi:Secretion system C-terminal sorting domain